MNKVLRAITAGLIAAMTLSILPGCNLVEVDQEKEDQEVLAKVGSEVITRKEFMNTYTMLAYNYGLSYEDTSEFNGQIKAYALDLVTSMRVQQIKAKELGYTNFTDAERAEAEKSVNEALQESYDSAVEYYTSLKESGDENADIDPTARADEEKAQGLESYPMEERIEDELEMMAEEKMVEDLCKDITVSDEEINEEYNTRLENAKLNYEENPQAYSDEYMQEQEEPAIYTPGGYVYVKHILIKLSDEQAQEIRELRTEAVNAEEGSEEAETANTKADELVETYLKGIESKAAEVLKKATEAPDSFDALLEEYGEDPGSQSEPVKTKGYAVAKDSGMVKTFEEAALALAKDGDLSGLVASDYGYHIIKRIGMSQESQRTLEELKETIHTDLLETKKNDFMTEKLQTWIEELAPKKYYDRIGVTIEEETPEETAATE